MFRTLADMLAARVESEKGIIYILSERLEKKVFYKELDRAARGVLHHLQEHGLKSGDELILQIDNNEMFLNVFWAGILGRIIPVPVSTGSQDEHKRKIFRIWDVLNSPYLIISRNRFETLKSFALEEGLVEQLAVVEARTVFLDDVLEITELADVVPAEPQDVAFIQFSSGSTGDPKGVVLTHANVLTNLRAIAIGMEGKTHESTLSWLPLTHDMGLIGMHLTPIFVGFDQYLFDPSLFVRYPLLWLQKASEHRVVYLCTPNFGFKFFLQAFRSAELADGWDLSSIKIIFNGAEPIDAGLVRKFCEVLQPFGLNAGAIFDVYGLAEASLAATFPPVGEGLRSLLVDRGSLGIGERVREVFPDDTTRAYEVVNLGAPVADCEVRICDESRVLGEGVVGYVEIKGGNVTQGYYQNPQETAKLFSEDGWLNTGDLGFLHGGRLYLTGRAKDVIFVQGQNYYPHDIERAVADVEGVNRGEVAACGVYHDELHREEIHLFVLFKKKIEAFPPVAAEIRRRLSEGMGLAVGDVLPVKHLPKTTSGKLQRYLLAEDYRKGRFDTLIAEVREWMQSAESSEIEGRQGSTQRELLRIAREVLGIPEVGAHDNFAQYEVTSLQMVQMHERVEQVYPHRVMLSDLFVYPSVSMLAEYLDGSGQSQQAEKRVEPQTGAGQDIAIIGVGVKMPNAETVEQFWENIRSGIDCTRHFPEERRRDADRYLQAKGGHTGEFKYRQGSYLDGIDLFDYELFGLTPQEANLMSPVHRLVLETAWTVVEDAGYGGNKLAQTETGVYLGFISDLEGSTYKEMIERLETDSVSVSVGGNLASMIPGRISYALNLRGPSVLIDTACSSSLVAVDHACRAIRDGSCQMAIAGGVRLSLLPVERENHKIGIESTDARTRTYDERSSGSGLGEGIGLVFLKPLEQALRDKDSIYAVIKGSAVNQDGTSLGITAPNPAAQEQVIVKAWEDAGIDPETISYIEAHGTGTRLGDLIEIDGLRGAFRRYTDKKQFCAISSVKTNIGHLYESAGIAGLIKTVMALRNKQLPPSLHFQSPNRQIDFLDSPVYVNSKLRAWETEDGRMRRAGVSSFGLSGTNCHVVLEEAPVSALVEPCNFPHVLVLSAKSERALQELVVRYADFVTHQEFRLTDVCYTASTGRHHRAQRLALVIENEQELREELARLQVGVESSRVLRGVMKGMGTERLTLEAKELVRQMEQSVERTVANVERLGTLYVQGADIEWERFWHGMDAKRVHVPIYPFQRKRCWIRLPEVEKDDLFYAMNWVPEPIAQTVKRNDSQGEVLILADALGLGERIAARYEAEGQRCLRVELGERYQRLGEDRYRIGGEEADYIRLFQELKEAGHTLSQIVHLFAYTGRQEIQELEELQQSQLRGVYSLFYLTRALIRNRFDETLDVCLVADHVEEVSGDEEYLKPESAPLFGLGKSLSLEHPHIRCRSVDVEEQVDLDALFMELNAAGGRYQTAHRNGKRYVQQFTEVKPQDWLDSPVEFTTDGIYLITGGLGGIGLKVAKWLARQGPVRLALVNRTPMPPREQWEEWLKQQEDLKLSDKIRTCLEIESLGGSVESYAVDISNLEETASLLDQLRTKHGRIRGIVHAAGNPGNGFLARKEQGVFDDVIAPKVQGTWILDQLTRGDELEFFLLFSSGISLLGEAGQGDYVAANAYLDAYAAHRNRRGQATTTIHWVAWQSVGTSVEHGFNADWVFKALPTEQALQGLATVMQKRVGRVLIGELNTNSPYLSVLNNHSFTVSPKIHSLIGSKDQAVIAHAPHIRNLGEMRAQNEVRISGKQGADYSEIERRLAQMYRDLLGYEEINIEDSFFELGGNSLMLKRLYTMIEAEFPGQIKATDLFAYTSVSGLAKHLTDQASATKNKVRAATGSDVSGDEIAVIGLAVHMPMAPNADTFWSNIVNGLDCTGPLSERRTQDLHEYLQVAEGVPPEDVRFVGGAFLEDIDEFDYKFFKMTPAEAKLTDPHQRLFLKTVWHAIEDAGYGGERLAGTNTGVYAGYATHLKDSYLRMIHEVDPEQIPLSVVGNISSMLPSRICYLLNLKGPAIVVDTACSSALVAVHTACRDLLSGDCDTAIVAGVRINIMPIDRVNEKIGIESATGRTMAFDQQANGSAIGEGAAAVLLKPLKQALADNDRIYAVVKGSAYNQDGASMGITAPNPTAQEAVLVKAWQKANVDPETLAFIECHGTATPLGDPIEVDALSRAFRHFTEGNQFCAIGSVKTNIGHLFEAAGVASFVKAVLALKHKTIPPSLHFNQPNPQISFADSPVYVNTRARKWERSEEPMRCGVSSFGFSGTNCHVVLEEWEPAEQVSHTSNSPLVLTLSAKSQASFQQMVEEYKAYFAAGQEATIRDVCYTANTGRGHYSYRLALLVNPDQSFESLAERLQLVRTEEDQSAMGIFCGHHRNTDRQDVADRASLTDQQRKELSLQAQEKLATFLQHGQRDRDQLLEVCRLYVQGADVEWESLFLDRAAAKVELPAYPFEKNRCWLEVPTQQKGRLGEPERDCYFATRWKPEPLPAHATWNTDGAVLLLLDEKGLGHQLAVRYRGMGRRVIEVAYGEAFAKLGEDRYVCSGTEAAYGQLLAGLESVPVQKVLHMHAITDQTDVKMEEDLDESQRRGVWSLYHLVRAWVEAQREHGVDLVLLAEHVAEVTGAEPNIQPESATLFGLGKVVRKEHPELLCRAVDVDAFTHVDQLFAELQAVTDLYQVSYRTGTRFVEEFTEIDVHPEAQQQVEIKEEGVYLISGGLGGIGLEVARYFAKQNRVRLLLLSRTLMPAREEWPDLLRSGAQPGLIQNIHALQEIESSGSVVECIQVDVADYEALASVLADIRTRYGRLDGIVHGAGVSSNESIMGGDAVDAAHVYRPKLQGTWHLDRLTRQDNVDFMVLFSSISTIFSAPGQGHYVAANAFLDSYAAYRNKQGLRTMTVNWSTWKETGMSVRHNINTDTLFKAIRTDDAIQRFERVLKQAIPRVLIGEVHYEGPMLFLLERNLFRLSPKITAELAKRQSVKKNERGFDSQRQVVLSSGSQDAQILEIEHSVYEICKKTLGFDDISIYDQFFELGADSILLTRMHAKLDQVYPGLVVVTDFFEHTSIHRLTHYIHSKISMAIQPETVSPAQKQEDELEDALRSIFDDLETGNLDLQAALNTIKSI